MTCRRTNGLGAGIDTEDAEIEYIEVKGEQAMLVTKDDSLQLVWPAKNNTLFLEVLTVGLNRDELLRVAEGLYY
jgi:hypothetical protein